MKFKKFLEIDSIAQNIEYMRRYLGEPILDLSHLTDSQIYDIGRVKLMEYAGFWGHWKLAKKYSNDTPGQDWKNIRKLMKKYKAER